MYNRHEPKVYKGGSESITPPDYTKHVIPAKEIKVIIKSNEQNRLLSEPKEPKG